MGLSPKGGNVKQQNRDHSRFNDISIGSDREKYNPQDEASYYEGENFELGGLDIDPDEEDGQREEEARNLSRFGEKFWNERDYVGSSESLPVSDQRIFEAACESLKESPFVDAFEIEVAVNKGVIYLRGHIANRNQKREAQQAVEHLKGVRDIMNELKIKS
jgi:hypothetical protein